MNKILERKVANNFVSNFNMCFGCSKEPSHSFVYPQHMFWFRSKKYHFSLHTLIKGAAYNSPPENALMSLPLCTFFQGFPGSHTPRAKSDICSKKK